MPPASTVFLVLFSVLFLLVSYLATLDIGRSLSPQGCRMSWMNPAYVIQRKFDRSWTPYAQRYSLWLYRETGWDSEIRGVPVLFIPGNAGSSRQVRSIASSAARQFYSSPGVVAPEFVSRSLKSLDFFAVEFNEDLSALHGSTLKSQIKYSSRAIDYILSLYPQSTPIILMGHSMGGVVATSLLPSPNVSAIITMSTPHTLPPARFDSIIDAIYRNNKLILEIDHTPIVSLCGGATDMMVPSESCVLPPRHNDDVFRRSIFTSAMEGAWTGVGHREMVWCHQIRWRIARAALEMGASPKGDTLDRWLRDGHSLPPPDQATTEAKLLLLDPSTFELLPASIHFVLKEPRGSKTYLLPTPEKPSSFKKLTVYVSQGSIASVSPQHPIPLKVTIFYCSAASGDADPTCRPLSPTSLRLIPNPQPEKSFPVPDEGSDESEGVVLFEADTSDFEDKIEDHLEWIGIHVADADGRGWVAGGFSQKDPLTIVSSAFSLLFGTMTVLLPNNLRNQVTFPNLLSSALVVYRITPIKHIEGISCPNSLLSPLIIHTSQPSETHYYPIDPHGHRILIHSHYPAPYIRHYLSTAPTLDFSIYSFGSTGCKSDLLGLKIDIDWSATIGRWASRYPTTLVSWAVGVAAIIVFNAWHRSDRGGAVPTVDESLIFYARKTLHKLLLASLLASVLPLSEDYYLGNKGEILFAPIAPLLLLLASGLVCISWWLLILLMWPIGKVGQLVFGRRQEDDSVHRSTIISMLMIFGLIFVFVPWQVAYLGCWLIHLHTCASLQHLNLYSGSLTPGASPIPLIRVRDTDANPQEDRTAEDNEHEAQHAFITQYRRPRTDNINHNMHVLLLMTWLLPLAAPVLAVWVRTLLTAGFTIPFDGDHDFLNVAPFLVLVDFASWNIGPLFERQGFEELLSVRWCLLLLSVIAFFVGPRQTYRVFDAAKVTFGLITMIRVGRRYWGGAPWSAPKPFR